MSIPLTFGINKLSSSERVKGINFSLASSDEVERLAPVSTEHATLYERGVSKTNGIMDSRLGTLDRRLYCSTCNKDCKSCPGHTGVIQFPIPVYHILFIESILRVLRSVCFFCSRVCGAAVVTNGKDLSSHQYSKHLFNKQHGACKTKRACIHCDGPCPEYSRDDDYIHVDWSNVTFSSLVEEEFCKRRFTILDVYNILTCISDEDASMLGFTPSLCHPRNFILWNLVVPSPAIRPSVMTSEGSRKRGQDDLTIKLQDIIKRRNDLRKIISEKKWCHSDIPVVFSLASAF